MSHSAPGSIVHYANGQCKLPINHTSQRALSLYYHQPAQTCERNRKDMDRKVLSIKFMQFVPFNKKASSGNKAMVFYLQVNTVPAGPNSVKLLFTTGFRRF